MAQQQAKCKLFPLKNLAIVSDLDLTVLPQIASTLQRPYGTPQPLFSRERGIESSLAVLYLKQTKIRGRPGNLPKEQSRI
jgi:hypothetical protein